MQILHRNTSRHSAEREIRCDVDVHVTAGSLLCSFDMRGDEMPYTSCRPCRYMSVAREYDQTCFLVCALHLQALVRDFQDQILRRSKA
jgi:hypothetical protein